MNKKESMEQIILETAESLFLEKGFALTSTTEIARKAGCNQALVHYYFRTKDKLFESVFEKKMMLFMSSFATVDKEEHTFLESLKCKITNHFDVLYQNQQLPFLFLNELVTNPERIKVFKDKFFREPLPFFQKFALDLNEEIDKGHIRPVSPIDLILSIASLNITIFLARPILKEMLVMNDSDFHEFARKRLEENITIILKSLEL